MARVLVYTPTYDDLLQPETARSIKAMQFNGGFDWVVSDENPYPGRDMRNVVAQFVKGRQLALDGGYDAMLIVEHDMIVPKDALGRLWETDADVVYASYQLRHGHASVNLFQYKGTQNLGMSLSLYPRELQAARERGWCEVSGAGFGCILIRRPVLEQVPFRGKDRPPDLPFATDCIKRKVRQIGRTDVECGHINIRNGRTLWPYRGGARGVIARVLALQDVTVQQDGNSVAMKHDRYYSIELEHAKELQRAGFVRITNQADHVAGQAAARETAQSTQAQGREIATAPEAEVQKVKPKRQRSSRSRSKAKKKDRATGDSD